MRETRTTDSVYIHDSIYIREGGDTVYMTRWRTKWRDRIVYDTVHEHTRDTILTVRNVKRVVKVPGKGAYSGWITAAALMLLIVVYVLIKTLLKQH